MLEESHGYLEDYNRDKLLQGHCALRGSRSLSGIIVLETHAYEIPSICLILISPDSNQKSLWHRELLLIDAIPFLSTIPRYEMHYVALKFESEIRISGILDVAPVSRDTRSRGSAARTAMVSRQIVTLIRVPAREASSGLDINSGKICKARPQFNSISRACRALQRISWHSFAPGALCFSFDKKNRFVPVLAAC